jgi:diguanylate cyclase (GGDEF)-like protein/PAS domain S-box-containing protein
LSLKEVFRQIDLHTPDGIPVRLNQIPILQALQGQPVIGERYVYTNRHKKRLTMLLSVAPITSDESFNGAVVVWHDVTEREQLVNQLEAERARLSAVIANAPEAILVADQKARIILANPLAERLYGWPIPYGEPYTARSRQRICYPNGEDYDPRDLPLTRAALDGEVVTNVEATVLLPDGGRRELLINAAPIFDRNGQPAGAIAVSQDIGSRKQIEAEIRKNAARAEVLSSLSQSFAEAGLYYAAVLSTITHQITEQIGDGSLIRLTSDDERWLDVVAMHHPENESLSSLRRVLRKRRLRTHEGVAGLAYQSHRPVLIHRSMAEQYRQPLVEEFDSWIHDNAPESILVVPLQAQGRLIGTLTVVRPRGGSPYTPDDQIFFMSLADRAALAIENAVLFADEARRAHELDALHSATVELLGTLDIDHLLTKIMNAAQSAIPVAERGALHLLEPQTGELAVRATLNPTDLRITHIARPDAHDFTSAVMRSRETLTVNDVQANLDGLTFDQLTAGEPPTFRALIAAPLMMGEDAIGVLSLTSSRPFAFNKDDVRLLKTFAATTSAAIQNAMLHAKVQTLAITDPLTEQYNRRGFFDLAQREMERFSRYQYPLAAIMLDIDHFKHVNDTHGHRVGDRVLRSLADRINQNIRQVDILGRYGGEEFVILLPETELFKACEIAERIRSAVSAEAILESENGPIQVTVSLGVTRATRGTSSLPELLEQADKALYQAKQNGRNRVEVM